MHNWKDFKSFIKVEVLISILLVILIIFFYLAGVPVLTVIFWAIAICAILIHILISLMSGGNEIDQTSVLLEEKADKLKQESEELFNEKKDIERKIDEISRELSTEKAKLALTLDCMRDGVIILDPDRRIVYFNGAVEILTEYSGEAVLGKQISAIFHFYEGGEEIPWLQYAPATIGLKGARYQKKNIEMAIRGNRRINVNLISLQIKEGLKVNVGCILVISDITREIQLKEDKFDFLAMAAHQLRTPVTALSGYVGELVSSKGAKSPTQQSISQKRIYAISKQLHLIIENLLYASNIEKGFQTLKRTDEDWVLFVSKIIDEYKDIVADKSITLDLKKPIEEIPRVLIDKVKIAGVMDNLLTNAISYTGADGTIRISIFKTDLAVVTKITDSGCGIPKEALPHLFSKFYQAKLPNWAHGSGLGLYICRIFVERHGGKIWVESEEGRGSTFYFSLPITLTSDKVELRSAI